MAVLLLGTYEPAFPGLPLYLVVLLCPLQKWSQTTTPDLCNTLETNQSNSQPPWTKNSVCHCISEWLTMFSSLQCMHECNLFGWPWVPVTRKIEVTWSTSIDKVSIRQIQEWWMRPSVDRAYHPWGKEEGNVKDELAIFCIKIHYMTILYGQAWGIYVV